MDFSMPGYVAGKIIAKIQTSPCQTTACTIPNPPTKMERQCRSQPWKTHPPSYRTGKEDHPTENREHLILWQSYRPHHDHGAINNCKRPSPSRAEDNQTYKSPIGLPRHTPRFNNEILCIRYDIKHSLRRIIPLGQKCTQQSGGALLPRSATERQQANLP